jgi:hypothetical protein
MRSALVGVLLLPALAVAYSAAPPQSYVKPIPGGKFVLVMITPHESKEHPSVVARRYGKSGLYKADETKNPVWACDWCAEYQANVTVSVDGEWVVRVLDVERGLRHWLLGDDDRPQKPHQPGWEDRPVAWVYRKGQLVRTLAVKDLFDTSRFTGNDCFMGPVLTLDPMDAAGQVRVATAHADNSRQSATIDARTGEVTDRQAGRLPFEDCGNNGPSNDWASWVWVAVIGMGVVGAGTGAVVALTAVLVRRQRSGK